LKAFTDEQLMRQVATGNLEALPVLFERHHKHVYNFLFKMSRDQMLSEDLTQEVFYKVIKYKESYREGNFISWLFTIARNSLSSYYTRKKENHTYLDAVAYKISEAETEDYSHLDMALQKLDPSDRELIILNRLQEIKYNELAEITNSTPGAVKTKVSRALKKLRVIYFQTI
tara:strand:- start:174752 stop:175267 length:516 start_codon:yes stop_codon:yes gene_type:complete